MTGTAVSLHAFVDHPDAHTYISDSVTSEKEVHTGVGERQFMQMSGCRGHTSNVLALGKRVAVDSDGRVGTACCG